MPPQEQVVTVVSMADDEREPDWGGLPLCGSFSRSQTPAIVTALRDHMLNTSFVRGGEDISIGEMRVTVARFVAVREELRAPPRAGELPHLLTSPSFLLFYPRAGGHALVEGHPALLSGVQDVRVPGPRQGGL